MLQDGFVRRREVDSVVFVLLCFAWVVFWGDFDVRMIPFFCSLGTARL